MSHWEGREKQTEEEMSYLERAPSSASHGGSRFFRSIRSVVHTILRDTPLALCPGKTKASMILSGQLLQRSDRPKTLVHLSISHRL